MNVKKIFDFVVLRPAWSTRNVTSLLLVALFFGVYVAAGGKITAMPKLKQGASFGDLATDSAETGATDDEQSGRMVSNEPAQVRPPIVEDTSPQKSLTLGTQDFSLHTKRVEERPIVREPVADSAAAENKNKADSMPQDELSDIEARLNIRSRK